MSVLHFFFQTTKHFSQDNVQEFGTAVQSTPDEMHCEENLDEDLMSDDDGDTDESGDEFVLDSDEEQNCDTDSDDRDDTNDENITTKNFVR